MKPTPTIAFFAILGFEAAAPAQASDAVADSPLMGLAHFVSVDPLTYGPTGTLVDATVVLAKEYGFASGAPGIPAVLPGKPNFTPGMMFPGLVTRPDIDAISIGMDWIWATSSGIVVIPPSPNWSALTFSVSRTSVGKAGSRLALEASRPDGAGADIFDYLFPSPALPPVLRDKVHLVQDSSSLAVWDGVHKSSLDGVDIFMPLYDLDPAIAALLPATPWFYFSVSKATLASVPAAWWGATTPSGASILRMRWTGAAWTTPTVWIRYDELGLLSDAEVDALAVDEAHGFMLFSTKGNAPDEIMFANLSADAISTAVYRYSEAAGDTVSNRIGMAAGDDLDAICALDPGASPVLRAALAARPLTPLLPFQSFVASSVLRRRGATPTQAQVDSWLTGYPLNQPQQGLGVFFVQGVTPPTQPIQLFQTTRIPGGLWGGAPTHALVSIPTSPNLFGIDLDFTWAAVNVPLNVVDLTIPARLRI